MVKSMKKTLNCILLILDVLAICALFIFYGPWDGFRNWYVTTALSTSSHKYLAYTLYSEQALQEIMSNNQFYANTDNTDASLISFSQQQSDELTELEKEILARDYDQDYKVIKISGSNYTGWLTVIYDPQRLDLAIADSDKGSTVSDLALQNNALVAVNGGGFAQSRGEKAADGGLIVDGSLYCPSEESEELISLTADGKLLLTYGKTQQLIQNNDISWSLHFSPFLIVNGVSSSSSGNAGGQQPRTAIGQRADGIIILMTIDGRGSNNSFGVNYQQMIDIFEQCGCINAANLDGGGSTTLIVEGELINDPASKSTERRVFDAIIFS